MEFRRPIIVLIYVARATDEGYEYLIMRRVPRLGGYWQGVTGAIESSEEPRQAAERELLEETGLSPDTVEAIDYSYAFEVPDELRHLYDPKVADLVLHCFLGVVEGGEPRLSSEHDAWKWCRADEAIALVKYPGNAEALRRCDAMLSGRMGH